VVESAWEKPSRREVKRERRSFWRYPEEVFARIARARQQQVTHYGRKVFLSKERVPRDFPKISRSQSANHSVFTAWGKPL
jgi:hypothetical protein